MFDHLPLHCAWMTPTSKGDVRTPLSEPTGFSAYSARRLRHTPKPARPEPSSNREAGSGTGPPGAATIHWPVELFNSVVEEPSDVVTNVPLKTTGSMSSTVTLKPPSDPATAAPNTRGDVVSQDHQAPVWEKAHPAGAPPVPIDPLFRMLNEEMFGESALLSRV